MRTRQDGFAIIELGLVLIAVGIVGFVAWRILDAQNTVNTTQIPQETIVQDSVPAVKDASDLDMLNQELDKADLDSNSTLTQLEEQTNF